MFIIEHFFVICYGVGECLFIYWVGTLTIIVNVAGGMKGCNGKTGLPWCFFSGLLGFAVFSYDSLIFRTAYKVACLRFLGKDCKLSKDWGSVGNKLF